MHPPRTEPTTRQHILGRHAGLAVTLALLCCITAVSHAGDIYRWVDDKGVTHMGDSVPDAYKAQAKVVGSTEATIDAKDQNDAKARARADAARLRQIEASQQSLPSTPVASDQAKAPAPPASAGTDCASLYAAYRASQACYAPYVTVNGLRGGANNCTPVPDPSAQCGSPTSSSSN